MLTIVQDDEENAFSNAFKRLAISEEGNFGNRDIESDREVVNKAQESCQGCTKSDTAIAELQLDVAMLSAYYTRIRKQYLPNLLKCKSSMF